MRGIWREARGVEEWQGRAKAPHRVRKIAPQVWRVIRSAKRPFRIPAPARRVFQKPREARGLFPGLQASNQNTSLATVQFRLTPSHFRHALVAIHRGKGIRGTQPEKS